MNDSPLIEYLYLYPNCMGKLQVQYMLAQAPAVLINAQFVGTVNGLHQFKCYDKEGKPWDGITMAPLQHFKPFLRPLRDLKDEDFYSWFAERKGERLLKATVNGLWSVGYFDNDEYDDLVKNELPVDDYSLLTEMEDNDVHCVYSCSNKGIVAYGTGEELRYFLDLHLLADWINHLRKRQIDCDALIERGWAIEATNAHTVNL
jgi:hypothetical protein